MFIIVVLAAGPIAYYLANLEYRLFLSGNNIGIFVDYIGVVFKTCYIIFIIMYIAINVLKVPQRGDYIRRDVEKIN